MVAIITVGFTTYFVASKINILYSHQITQESIKEPENEEIIENNNSHFIQELDRNKKSNVEDNNKLECKLNLATDHNTNNFTNINNTSKIDSIDIKENIDPILEKTKNIIENEISIGEQISTSTYNEKCILETKTENDLKVLSESQLLQSANVCINTFSIYTIFVSY